MTDQLVQNVGLWCVEGDGLMAHVLRRREAAIGEASEELSGRHEARDGAQSPTAQLGEAVGDIGELRDPITRQIEYRRGVAVLLHRILGVQFGERGVDGGPDFVLDPGVLDEWRTAAEWQIGRQGRDVISPADVRRIREAGVIGREFENRTAHTTMIALSR
jgi:hypothetical protein